MDKQAIEKMYSDKKQYVEITLAAMLAPIHSFGSIKYARDARSGEEYIKITEANGYPWFICVTGDSESAIGKEVCRMVGENTPIGLVRSKSAQIQINKMFGGM